MRLLMVSNKIKTYPLLYRNILEVLAELGHSVVWAADFSQFIGDKSAIPCRTEQLCIRSNPVNPQNLKAYRQLLALIEGHRIEGVLCSTPIGGTLARLAALKKGVTPVIYEAHGFLFHDRVPPVRQALFRLHEAWLSRYTDALITITKDDFEAAQKFPIRSGRAPYFVHGAGVSAGAKPVVDRIQKRKELSIPRDAFLTISAGELNRNKNVIAIVRALAFLRKENAYHIACGVGSERERLLRAAEKAGVSDRFRLLGYRTDVPELLAVSDAFIMPSYREGVPRALLEAMDAGLPCVGSDTRGIRDLIDHGTGGYLCAPDRPGEFADALRKLMNNEALRVQMGLRNHGKVRPYSSEVVRRELLNIYRETLGSAQ